MSSSGEKRARGGDEDGVEEDEMMGMGSSSTSSSGKSSPVYKKLKFDSEEVREIERKGGDDDAENGDREDEWLEYFDESSEMPYYYNVNTQETKWEKPSGNVRVAEDADYDSSSDAESSKEESNGGSANAIDEAIPFSKDADDVDIAQYNAEDISSSDDDEKYTPQPNSISAHVEFMSKSWQQQRTSSSSSSSEVNLGDAVDSILEPSILRNIAHALSSSQNVNVQVKSVMSDLSKKFRGFPAQVKTLASWLHTTSAKDHVVKKDAESDTCDESEEIILNSFRLEMKRHLRRIKGGSHALLDKTLRANAPPKWVECLARSDEFSPFLVSLSKQEPRSLLLNYAVRRAIDCKCERAGGCEISSSLPAPGVEGTTNNFFRSFRKLLMRTLVDLRSARDDITYESRMKYLMHLTERSLHAHVFTIASLDAMIAKCSPKNVDGNPGDTLDAEREWWRGVRDRLQINVYTKQGALPFKVLSKRTVGITASESERQLWMRMCKIWEWITNHNVAEPDACAELCSLFDAADVGVSVPRRCIILLPFLRLLAPVLIAQLVHPFKLEFQSKSHRKNTCKLLALCSYDDDDDEDAADSVVQMLDQETYLALMKVSEVFKCPTVLQETRGSSAYIVTTLHRHLHIPIVAMVTLRWIREAWFSHYSRGNNFVHITCVRAFSELIHCIIEQHPLHHRDAFDILCSGLFVQVAKDVHADKWLAAKRGLVTQMIHALTVPTFGRRFAVSLIEHMRDKLAELDFFLIRHFVGRLWEVLKPPFSSAFGASLFKLFDDEKTKRAINGVDDRATFRAVSEWREAHRAKFS
eukprot:g3199.t1